MLEDKLKPLKGAVLSIILCIISLIASVIYIKNIDLLSSFLSAASLFCYVFIVCSLRTFYDFKFIKRYYQHMMLTSGGVFLLLSTLITRYLNSM